MNNKNQSDYIVDEKINSANQPTDHKPVYQKPKTSLFLEKATDIQSGIDAILESQGGGYLTS